MYEHDPFPADVPRDHRIAAEHVRAHLVFLRGGAPFLSPADTLCLLEWLDREVPVQAILAALERCAESRRRNRARRPFTLRSARVHLGKPPLSEVSGTLPAPVREELEGLAVVDAAARCRGRIEQSWGALAEHERQGLLQAALQELGDLAKLVDEATLLGLAEEVARDRFRQSFPRTDIAVLEVALS